VACLFGLEVSSARAEPSLSDSILKITAAESCGTAFVTNDGLIATNLHVLSHACSNTRCRGVKLESAAALGQNAGKILLDHGELAIVRELASLDLIFLRPVGALQLPKSELVLSTQPPAPDEELQVVGFPRCQLLSQSSGVIESSGALRFKLSNQGFHGSSGSPVLTKGREVVGIVDQAADFSSAAFGLVSGKNFSLSALRSDLLNSLLQTPSDQSSLGEIELLNRFYSSDVEPLSGLARAEKSVEFLSAVQALRRSPLFETGSADELRLLNGIGEYLSFLPSFQLEKPASQRTFQLAKLVAQSMLEEKGPFSKFLLPLDRSLLNSGLSASGWEPGQTEEFLKCLDRFKESNYLGLNLFAIKFGTRLFFLALLLVVCVGLTLGVMYTELQGSLLKRFAVLVLWGLCFWPVSVLLFWLTRRVSRKV